MRVVVFVVLLVPAVGQTQQENPTQAPTQLSRVFGSDWLAHTDDSNPYSCGGRCITPATPWASPPKYEGSVNLSLNYRTENDDRLYSSDGGAADRYDRFNNTHYFRSSWYFDFNRTVGEWFEVPYSIQTHNQAAASLPSDQILYGDAPIIAQRGYHTGNYIDSRSVLELTANAYSQSGAIVVKVPPDCNHQTRLRFKVFAGGNRASGGGGYGAYLMPRQEWDRLYFDGQAFNWHGRNEHVPTTEGYGFSVKTDPIDRAGLSLRVKVASEDDAQYRYVPATVRYDYRSQTTGFQGTSTDFRRPGNPMCRPEARSYDSLGNPNCECTSFSNVKPQWNLGNLPCCSSQFPTPLGVLGTHWCYCQPLGNNPIWRTCNGSLEEKMSWQYVEIKVNNSRITVSHDSSQVFDMQINGGPLGVDDNWVFLVGASTEPDLKDMHVLDELEVAHWHAKMLPQPPDSVKFDSAITHTANVSWVPHPDDGGSPVTEYQLVGESTDLTTGVKNSLPTRSCPARIGSQPHGNLITSCTLTGLLRGTHYKYTFHAVSEVGIGPGLESIGRSPLQFETPSDYSDHPENIQIMSCDSTWHSGSSCDLTWEYPLDDGGANIESYKIVTTVEDDSPTGPFFPSQINDTFVIDRVRNSTLNEGKVVLSATVRGLYRISQYSFQIAAGNFRGYYNCPPHIKCISGHTRVVKTPPQVPTPPDALSLDTVPFYDWDRMRVNFEPSIEDGGRPLIGFKFYTQAGTCTTDQCRAYRKQEIVSSGFGPLCRTADMPLNHPKRIRCIKNTGLNPGVFSKYQVVVGMVRNKWHWYWVTAVNEVGESDFSPQWLGIQSPDVPKVSEFSHMSTSVATQSSTWKGEAGCSTPSDFNYNLADPPCSGAKLAIDDLDGFDFGHFKFGSVAATHLEAYPWWQLDFGAPTTIFFLRIWRRLDCCELPRNVKISVVDVAGGRRSSKWEYFTTDSDRDMMTNALSFLELWPYTMGNAIRIEPQWPFFLLSLAEVRVFGWSKGCPEEFTCTNQAVCNPNTRRCDCLPGFEGLTCDQDHRNAYNDGLLSACVDGNVSLLALAPVFPSAVESALESVLGWGSNSNYTTRNIPNASAVEKCTIPSHEACSAFEECKEKKEPPEAVQQFLRIVDMLLISILFSGIATVAISGCMGFWWLKSGIARDKTADAQELHLDKIRRRIDIAKVVPEEDLPDHMKLPKLPKVNPKILHKVHPALQGSSRKEARKDAREGGDKYLIGHAWTPAPEDIDARDSRLSAENCSDIASGLKQVVSARKKFLLVAGGIVGVTIFIGQLFMSFLGGTCLGMFLPNLDC